MNLFEKFSLARQIQFKDGEINLLNQRVVIIPSAFFKYYTLKINKNLDLIKKLYNSTKKALRMQFGVKVGKEFGFSFKDYTNWFADIAEISGWGIAEWKEINEESKYAVLTISDSPIASSLKGSVDTPCDHIVRGLMAGSASSAFKMDMDVIETECLAIGGQSCKFVIDSSANLKQNFPSLYKIQIGD